MRYDTTDWRHRAACRDEDPELFFPVSEVGPGAGETARAKSVCASCPVRAACLEYALDNGLNYGVFGGLTESERREVARKTRRDVHAA